MHNDVPLSVVLSEVLDVPPVLIELSIAEPYDLGEDVHPGVQDSIEEDQKADHSTYGREDD